MNATVEKHGAALLVRAQQGIIVTPRMLGGHLCKTAKTVVRRQGSLDVYSRRAWGPVLASFPLDEVLEISAFGVGRKSQC